MRITAIFLVLIGFLAVTPAHADMGWGGSGRFLGATKQQWDHTYQRATRHKVAETGDQRPRMWCGWFLRNKLGVADRTFNLARSWFQWGHANHGPCVGCVAVSYHHVGLITGYDGKHYIVEQGNPYRNGPDTLRWAVAYRSP